MSMVGPPYSLGAERARLNESPSPSSPWRQWGPYLSGRQWGTVREDYSADGDAWNSFPFEQAHARAYRWGEDGLGGFCDNLGFLNFSIALWNGRDPILKERLYGLTNEQGNHGEDAKEYWWAVDGTPTHSWAKWLYRYPQAEYPYAQLRAENGRRTRADREYELADTGVLDQNRFFDVSVSYAKAAPDDICIEIEVTNHGPDAAPLHLLPQLWFRNTWAWGRDARRPTLHAMSPLERGIGHLSAVATEHAYLGRYVLSAEGTTGRPGPEVLICSNETNAVGLWGVERNPARYTKDGINRRVVNGDLSATGSGNDSDFENDRDSGPDSKAAFWYSFDAIPAGETVRVRLRLSRDDPGEQTFDRGFDAVVADRRAEADEFYTTVLPADTSAEDRHIARRAFAGLLWGKQVYRYDVQDWLEGDPAPPRPPARRRSRDARNVGWTHLSLADVISMPDEWEYPWFAAWDLAFHCVAFAHVDPAFAKDQLVLMCREWAMRPDGQLPSYEWAFGDLNPPVHAWAAWQVYIIDGRRDTDFLIRVFTKLLLNFASWVNREDADGSNLFEGGFLGMDNIGLYDRSVPLGPGYQLEQSDATSWMGFYCLIMLQTALELARADKVWDDLATKFLEHFLGIASAVNDFGSTGVDLWDEEDGFCYDVVRRPDGSIDRLRVRSMVGLLPILAVAAAEPWVAEELPDFTSRLRWLSKRRPDLMGGLMTTADADGTHALLSLLGPDRLPRVLVRMLDENEFLSPFGIRSLSAVYRTPFTTSVAGTIHSIDYEPGESTINLFGGNSNWRGPVWLPVNVLLTAALRTYATHQPGATMIEMPTGSGRAMPLDQIADDIDQRLISLFRKGPSGARPSDGARIEASADPLWREQVTFSEYFHADTGEGLGATHQTGWTALVAHLICQRNQ